MVEDKPILNQKITRGIEPSSGKEVLFKQTNYKDGSVGWDLIDKVEATEDGMDWFEANKNSVVSMARRSGLAEEKVQEIIDRVKTPKELENVRQTFNLLSDARRLRRPDSSRPPQSSVVPLIPESQRGFSKYRGNTPEVISRLYRDSQSPDRQTSQYATDLLDKLWKKAWYSMKDKMDRGEPLFGEELVSCPSCSRAISRTSRECQFCGFPLDQQRQRGLEV